MDLATCSFTEFQSEMGVAVRTTVGAPRYQLPYTVTGHARLVTPTAPMLKMDSAAFGHAYTLLLDGRGVEAIAAELARIGRSARTDRLVLLCFERLNTAGAWCHRQMFAVWWLAQTGEEVPELGQLGRDTPPPPAQTLFDL